VTGEKDESVSAMAARIAKKWEQYGK